MSFMLVHKTDQLQVELASFMALRCFPWRVVQFPHHRSRVRCQQHPNLAALPPISWQAPMPLRFKWFKNMRM